MGIFPVGDLNYEAVLAQEAALVDASEVIAEALERSGLTQAELARLLGVSRSEVTARLRGTRNITVKSLAETLQVLGCRLHLALDESDSNDEEGRSSLEAWRPVTWDEASSHRTDRVRHLSSRWTTSDAVH